MYIKMLKILGFRCFKSISIELEPEITALLGTNGTGKTAALHALTKLFGSQEQRTLHRTDFRVEPDDVDAKNRQLVIEVFLSFPELHCETQEAESTVPAVFTQMSIDGPSGELICRYRYEATWQDDGTAEGDVEWIDYWVTTLEDVSFGSDERKCRVKQADRRLIQVRYVPANRDTSTMGKDSIRQLLYRILRLVHWSDELKGKLDALNMDVRTVFQAESAIRQLLGILTKGWNKLNDSRFHTDPQLSTLSGDLDSFMRRLSFTFLSDEYGRERDISALSDGQKSLFYLSLISTLFEMEQMGLDNPDSSGLDSEKLRLQAPALTVFAVEEPENHLSPFFLPRVVNMLRDSVQSARAMAIISSHSPSVVGRIAPEDIRYLRLEPSGNTVVAKIQLPENEDEAFKYVREAVIAHPELYFAKFVILGEGDSEQVILPKLAQALGVDFDPSFVAIVPLGGRHVNHFWRLLEGLGTPYLTLLDLDIGRAHGGLARIKGTYETLNAYRHVDNSRLSQRCQDVISGPLPETWDIKQFDVIPEWISWFETQDVYFSAPLDLDMMFLSNYSEAYKKLADGERGPHIDGASQAVLGSGGYGDAICSGDLTILKDLMPWYRYRFLTKSKPVAHLTVLSTMSDSALAEGCPDVLRKLICDVDATLGNRGKDH